MVTGGIVSDLSVSDISYIVVIQRGPSRNPINTTYSCHNNDTLAIESATAHTI